MELQQECVQLDKCQHDIKAFDCGKPVMNQFLARFAQKNMMLGLSSTWVLPVITGEPGKKTSLAAYYTLAMTTVHKTQIPNHRQLPGYPVPVILLARLAVDAHFQRVGLGAKLLVYALRHAVKLNDRGLPAFGLIIDILDEHALTFYRKFEVFDTFTDNPMRLFVPMSTLRKL